MKNIILVLAVVGMMVVSTVAYAGSARPGKAPAWVVGNDCAHTLELEMPYWTCRWSTSQKCTWTQQDKIDYDKCIEENI